MNIATLGKKFVGLGNLLQNPDASMRELVADSRDCGLDFQFRVVPVVLPAEEETFTGITHDEVMQLISGKLDHYFPSDQGEYIDFDEYVFAINPAVPEEDRTYACWRFTLCFHFDVLTDCYATFALNTPGGWDGEPLLEEHKAAVEEALHGFKCQLVTLGFPRDIIFGGETNVQVS